MIEKLGTDAAKHLSKPCDEMIEYLENMLNHDPSPLTVAEVGVGYGATSVEIVKRLRRGDTFFLFWSPKSGLLHFQRMESVL